MTKILRKALSCLLALSLAVLSPGLEGYQALAGKTRPSRINLRLGSGGPIGPRNLKIETVQPAALQPLPILNSLPLQNAASSLEGSASPRPARPGQNPEKKVPAARALERLQNQMAKPGSDPAQQKAALDRLYDLDGSGSDGSLPDDENQPLGSSRSPSTPQSTASIWPQLEREMAAAVKLENQSSRVEDWKRETAQALRNDSGLPLNEALARGFAKAYGLGENEKSEVREFLDLPFLVSIQRAHPYTPLSLRPASFDGKLYVWTGNQDVNKMWSPATDLFEKSPNSWEKLDPTLIENISQLNGRTHALDREGLKLVVKTGQGLSLMKAGLPRKSLRFDNMLFALADNGLFVLKGDHWERASDKIGGDDPVVEFGDELYAAGREGIEKLSKGSRGTGWSLMWPNQGWRVQHLARTPNGLLAFVLVFNGGNRVYRLENGQWVRQNIRYPELTVVGGVAEAAGQIYLTAKSKLYWLGPAGFQEIPLQRRWASLGFRPFDNLRVFSHDRSLYLHQSGDLFSLELELRNLPKDWSGQVTKDLEAAVGKSVAVEEKRVLENISQEESPSILQTEDGKTLFSGLARRLGPLFTLVLLAATYVGQKIAEFFSTPLGFADLNQKPEQAREPPESIWPQLEQEIVAELKLGNQPSRIEDWKRETAQALRNDPGLPLNEVLARGFAKAYGLGENQKDNIRELLDRPDRKSMQPVRHAPMVPPLYSASFDGQLYVWAGNKNARRLWSPAADFFVEDAPNSLSQLNPALIEDIPQLNGRSYALDREGLKIVVKNDEDLALMKVGVPLKSLRFDGMFFVLTAEGLFVLNGSHWERPFKESKDIVQIEEFGGKLYAACRSHIFKLPKGGQADWSPIYNAHNTGAFIRFLAKTDKDLLFFTLNSPGRIYKLKNNGEWVRTNIQYQEQSEGIAEADGQIYLINKGWLYRLESRGFRRIPLDWSYYLGLSGADSLRLFSHNGSLYLYQSIAGSYEGQRYKLLKLELKLENLPKDWAVEVMKDLEAILQKSAAIREGRLSKSVSQEKDPSVLQAEDGKILFSGLAQKFPPFLTLVLLAATYAGQKITELFSTPLGFADFNQKPEQAKEPPQNADSIWSQLEQEIAAELKLESQPSRVEDWRRETAQALRNDPQLPLNEALALGFAKAYGLDEGRKVRLKVKLKVRLRDFLVWPHGIIKLAQWPKGTYLHTASIEGQLYAWVTGADKAGTVRWSLAKDLLVEEGFNRLRRLDKALIKDVSQLNGKSYALDRQGLKIVVKTNGNLKLMKAGLPGESFRFDGFLFIPAAEGLFVLKGDHWETSSVRVSRSSSIKEFGGKLYAAVPGRGTYELSKGSQGMGWGLMSRHGGVGVLAEVGNQLLDFGAEETYALRKRKWVKTEMHYSKDPNGYSAAAEVRGTIYLATLSVLYEWEQGAFRPVPLERLGALQDLLGDDHINVFSHNGHLYLTIQNFYGNSQPALFRVDSKLPKNWDGQVMKDLVAAIDKSVVVEEKRVLENAAPGEDRNVLQTEDGKTLFSSLARRLGPLFTLVLLAATHAAQRIVELFGHMPLGSGDLQKGSIGPPNPEPAKEKAKTPLHFLPFDEQMKALFEKYKVPPGDRAYRKKLTQDAVDRVKLDLAFFTGNPNLHVGFGPWWLTAIEDFRDQRLKEIMVPLEDIFIRAVDLLGVEEAVGVALHEVGHYMITRPDFNSKLTQKYLTTESPPANNLLCQGIEDTRVNTWALLTEPGQAPYFDAFYNAEWPDNPEDTQALKRSRLGILSHSALQIEEPGKEMKLWVPPHVQYVDSIVYYWRHRKAPPFLTDEMAKEVFEKTKDSLDRIRNIHPKPAGDVILEIAKTRAFVEALSTLDREIYPLYEKLVQKSEQDLKKMLEQGAGVSQPGQEGQGQGSSGSGQSNSPSQGSGKKGKKGGQKGSSQGQESGDSQGQEDGQAGGGQSKGSQKGDKKAGQGGGGAKGILRKLEKGLSERMGDTEDRIRAIQEGLSGAGKEESKDPAAQEGKEEPKDPAAKDGKESEKEPAEGKDPKTEKPSETGPGDDPYSFIKSRDIALEEAKRMESLTTTYERYKLRAKELGLIDRVDGIIKRVLLPTTHSRLSRLHYEDGDEPDMEKYQDDAAQGRFDTPIMQRWNRKIRRKASISLVLDISGSMGGLTPEMNSPLDYALLGIVAWIEVCQKNNLEFEIILFDEKQHVAHPFGAVVNKESKEELIRKIVALEGGSTAIGEAYGLALKDVVKRRATHRFVIVATDEDHNTGKPPEDWQEQAKKNKVVTVALVIGGDTAGFKKHFDYAVRVEKPEDLPKNLLEVLKTAIRAVMGRFALPLMALMAFGLALAAKATSLVGSLPLGHGEALGREPEPPAQKPDLWQALERFISEGLSLPYAPRTEEWKRQTARVLREEPTLSVDKAMAKAFALTHGLSPEKEKDAESLLATGIVPELPEAGMIHDILVSGDRVFLAAEKGIFLREGRSGPWSRIVAYSGQVESAAGVGTIIHPVKSASLAELDGEVYFTVDEERLYKYSLAAGRLTQVASKAAIMDLKVFEGKLFVASHDGVWVLENKSRLRRLWEVLTFRWSRLRRVGSLRGWVNSLAVINGRLYAAGPGAIHVLEGKHWSNATGGPASMEGIYFAGGALYASTSDGLHSWDGRSWNREFEGLHLRPKVNQVIEINGKVYAATTGGVYVKENGTSRYWFPNAAVFRLAGLGDALLLGTGSGLFKAYPEGPSGLAKDWRERILEEIGNKLDGDSAERSLPLLTGDAEKSILKGPDGRELFSGWQGSH